MLMKLSMNNYLNSYMWFTFGINLIRNGCHSQLTYKNTGYRVEILMW